ncbi:MULTISPECIES: hypothetical protein [unclassified Oceanispirochaeta]|uniref:hypothetical protein n=1 Tax=unclassified Oceanispirochaeta TaxID=2635722 RepID=UPI000E08E7EE|nr:MULTISPECIES: hypothetical protein [unclassified Oceanispirochaeta]MBF9018441.1 hypothetical protein [Oceanispirochaeta sp. M2]NPD73893.1 hypothetical protein [Oceanispirochaeta sp. M1]RDG30352.1 hypothetical protein DV872_17495 [Oceanispirochaeta sp. M1]
MNQLIPFTAEGKEYSGIQSGLEPKVFRAVDISSLQNEPGWIYDKEGRMESWKLEGASEQDGSMIFYGPLIKGESFTAATLTLDRFEKIIRVFQALKHKDSSYKGFYSRSWFFLEDGRVLILPVSLMDFIRKSEKEESRVTNWYPYNHPDKLGTEGLDFTAAVLASQLLSGTHPYAPLEKAEDDRNEQLRRPPSLSPELMIPGLKDEIAGLISSSFKAEDSSLKEWSSIIDLWRKDGALRELSSTEKDEIKLKADQIVERGEKNRKRRQVWRRKNSLYIAIGAVVIFLGILISTPIRKSLEPPATMGMDARQVVESYYRSFNDMDQVIMEDCIEKKLGKGDIGEVTNIFVTSRVRMGYEGDSGIINAEEWVQSGRVAPGFGKSIYGVAELEINDLGSGQFRVVYEKWMPGTTQDSDISEAKPVPPYGLKVTDLLTLEEQKKGNWLIVERDRKIREISYP